MPPLGAAARSAGTTAEQTLRSTPVSSTDDEQRTRVERDLSGSRQGRTAPSRGATRWRSARRARRGAAPAVARQQASRPINCSETCAPLRAEREAHRHLAPANVPRTAERFARFDAGDEEDERDRTAQRPQRGSDVAHHFVFQSNDGRARPLAFDVRVTQGDALLHGLE